MKGIVEEFEPEIELTDRVPPKPSSDTPSRWKKPQIDRPLDKYGPGDFVYIEKPNIESSLDTNSTFHRYERRIMNAIDPKKVDRRYHEYEVKETLNLYFELGNNKTRLRPAAKEKIYHYLRLREMWKAEDVREMIRALPIPLDIRTSDERAIIRARNLFESCPKEFITLVNNTDKLDLAMRAVEEEKSAGIVRSVFEMVKPNDVSIDNYWQAKSALASYPSLTYDQKIRISDELLKRAKIIYNIHDERSPSEQATDLKDRAKNLRRDINSAQGSLEEYQNLAIQVRDINLDYEVSSLEVKELVNKGANKYLFEEEYELLSKIAIEENKLQIEKAKDAMRALRPLTPVQSDPTSTVAPPETESGSFQQMSEDELKDLLFKTDLATIEINKLYDIFSMEEVYEVFNQVTNDYSGGLDDYKADIREQLATLQFNRLSPWIFGEFSLSGTGILGFTYQDFLVNASYGQIKRQIDRVDDMTDLMMHIIPEAINKLKASYPDSRLGYEPYSSLDAYHQRAVEELRSKNMSLIGSQDTDLPPDVMTYLLNADSWLARANRVDRLTYNELEVYDKQGYRIHQDYRNFSKEKRNYPQVVKRAEEMSNVFSKVRIMQTTYRKLYNDFRSRGPIYEEEGRYFMTVKEYHDLIIARWQDPEAYGKLMVEFERFHDRAIEVMKVIDGLEHYQTDIADNIRYQIMDVTLGYKTNGDEEAYEDYLIQMHALELGRMNDVVKRGKYLNPSNYLKATEKELKKHFPYIYNLHHVFYGISDLLLDRYSIELYINDGTQYYGLTWFTRTEFYERRNIWNKRIKELKMPNEYYLHK